jgi:hypothetical protein
VILTAMTEIPTLYVCHDDGGDPRRHPCRRVQEARSRTGLAALADVQPDPLLDPVHPPILSSGAGVPLAVSAQHVGLERRRAWPASGRASGRLGAPAGPCLSRM